MGSLLIHFAHCWSIAVGARGGIVCALLAVLMLSSFSEPWRLSGRARRGGSNVSRVLRL